MHSKQEKKIYKSQFWENLFNEIWEEVWIFPLERQIQKMEYNSRLNTVSFTIATH